MNERKQVWLSNEMSCLNTLMTQRIDSKSLLHHHYRMPASVFTYIHNQQSQDICT